MMLVCFLNEFCETSTQRSLNGRSVNEIILSNGRTVRWAVEKQLGMGFAPFLLDAVQIENGR